MIGCRSLEIDWFSDSLKLTGSRPSTINSNKTSLQRTKGPKKKERSKAVRNNVSRPRAKDHGAYGAKPGNQKPRARSLTPPSPTDAQEPRMRT